MLARLAIHPLRGARGAAMISTLLLTLSACSDGEKSPPETRASTAHACSHDLLEPDLAAEGLRGPGIDETTGKLVLPAGAHYVVSSTYGVPKPGADGAPASERYLQLFAAIEAQLQREPGLLAITLGQSDRCHSGRTLAVWRSEDEMYDFVTSPAHLDAMRAASDILQPGYAVTHWDATAAEDVSFEKAVEQLAKVSPGP